MVTVNKSETVNLQRNDSIWKNSNAWQNNIDLCKDNKTNITYCSIGTFEYVISANLKFDVKRNFTSTTSKVTFEFINIPILSGYSWSKSGIAKGCNFDGLGGDLYTYSGSESDLLPASSIISYNANNV